MRLCISVSIYYISPPFPPFPPPPLTSICIPLSAHNSFQHRNKHKYTPRISCVFAHNRERLIRCEGQLVLVRVCVCVCVSVCACACLSICMCAYACVYGRW
jgi:hypothetical protein